MEAFYLIVLSIAVIFLILILIFVGIMMQSQNDGQSFPPVSKQCPDFWALSSDMSSCIVPGTTGTGTVISGPSGTNVGTLSTTITATSNKNVFNLVATGVTGLTGAAANPGKSPYNVIKDSSSNLYSVAINPNDTYWTSKGMTATCSQRMWANQVGIQWDGTSNYNGC